jgi:beta-lactamase regulating signal transducer with metallopeptidase domain
MMRPDEIAQAILGILSLQSVYALFLFLLVWFVMPRLTWTREAVCDATVLSHGTLSPRSYGRQMLAFVRSQALSKLSPQGLAEFTSAARGMAFRLHLIQIEDATDPTLLGTKREWEKGIRSLYEAAPRK